jgi:hypothetical protein
MSCELCSGKGYVIFKVGNETDFIEKLSYCPYCEAGERWQYDGSKLMKHRTNFCIESAAIYIRQPNARPKR